MEEVVSRYGDVRYVISNIGSERGDPFSQGGTGTHISRVALDFKDFHDRTRPSSEIVGRSGTGCWMRSAGRKFKWKRGGPMAVAVIFGLGGATPLTLMVAPVLVSLAHSARRRFRRK